jgi:DNA-binding response OmpR family regulator
MTRQQDPSEEEHSTRKTILIVEDDTAIGNFLMEAIAQETRYHSLLVPDGFQCLKTLKGIKPDLLLLDYYLPQMNGIELYDQLHAMHEYAGLPVILLTTNLDKRRQEIEERNIAGLNKPLELDDLLHAIEEVLG